MITYLFKAIICSAAFLLVYVLLLEKEKMHRFNRFYLLLGLFLPLAIPLVTITLGSTLLLPEETIGFITGNSKDNTLQSIPADAGNNYLPAILWTIYLSVTVFLLSRFIKNIHALFLKARINESVPFHEGTIVLTDDKHTPHSFLHYIFLNKEDFKNRNTEKEILCHELTHVRQKHSFDIILLELLLVFAWFNPFLYLYRKRIRLNHEFLADDAVIRDFNDPTAYQYLLLGKAGQPGSLSLTSCFNYLITKKRLIMMTRKTPIKIAILKQVALIPALAAAVFVFSTKSIAQKNPVVKPQQQQIASTPEGASPELMKEYENIINRITGTGNKYGPTFFQKISTAEKNRLETIFKQMSKEQQEKQIVAFMPAPPPLSKAVPTTGQLELWKDSKTYGLWIDDKRVSNDVLDKYTNTDFEQLFVSKLSKNAINYGKHYYQVNLMTKDHYRHYYDVAIENREPMMLIRLKSKPEKK